MENQRADRSLKKRLPMKDTKHADTKRLNGMSVSLERKQIKDTSKDAYRRERMTRGKGASGEMKILADCR